VMPKARCLFQSEGSDAHPNGFYATPQRFRDNTLKIMALLKRLAWRRLLSSNCGSTPDGGPIRVPGFVDAFGVWLQPNCRTASAFTASSPSNFPRAARALYSPVAFLFFTARPWRNRPERPWNSMDSSELYPAYLIPILSLP